MANIGKWKAPTGYSTAGFTASNFNSLANGSCVVAASAIANGTALDLFADVSFVLTVGGTTLSTSYLTLYILPLNRDGTTFGDNAATGSTPPVGSYIAASLAVPAGVASGSTIVGTFRNIVLPPRNFKFALANNLGVALNAAAAAVVEYSPFSEDLNG